MHHQDVQVDAEGFALGSLDGRRQAHGQCPADQRQSDPRMCKLIYAERHGFAEKTQTKTKSILLIFRSPLKAGGNCGNICGRDFGPKCFMNNVHYVRLLGD